MTPEQFVYWLQGYVELGDDTELAHGQWTIVKDHLKTVFDKESPTYLDRTKLPGQVIPTNGLPIY